jgi:hypothetical protein
MILRKDALDHGGEAWHEDTWPLEAYPIHPQPNDLLQSAKMFP